MELGRHFWRLARFRRLRATVLLHAPVDPADFPSRKALAQAVWQSVADGAAALRQNRPGQPGGFRLTRDGTIWHSSRRHTRPI